MWEENQKIMNIVNEKTFQPRLRTKKEKPRFIMRRETLVEKRLGLNKMLFSSQRSQTANGSIYQMQAPQHSLRQVDKSPASCRLLTPLKTKLTWIFPCCYTWRAL